MPPVGNKPSKNRLWIRLLIILVITGIVIGGAGLYFYYKPASRTVSADADLTLSATQLYTSFTRNADSASRAFNNKIIQVSGRVTSIDSDKGGNTNVSLDPGPQAMANVKAEFAPESKYDIKDIKNGDMINFKGLVHKQEDLMGIPGDIIIKNATLIK